MSDSDSNMNDARRNFDGILESDADSRVSDQVFRENTKETEECPAPAISMDALRPLIQTIKVASAGSKSEI